MSGNPIEFLIAQNLLDLVVRRCGGVYQVLPLRACCRAARAGVPPPPHCGDEEDLLLRASYSGDVQSCAFAISSGACRLYAAADVAASRGHLEAFTLLYSRYCSSPHSEFFMLISQYSLVLSAMRGGNRNIFNTVFKPMVHDTTAVGNVSVLTLLNGHPRSGITFLKDLIAEHSGSFTKDSKDYNAISLISHYIAGFDGSTPLPLTEVGRGAFTWFPELGGRLSDLTSMYAADPRDLELCGAASAGSLQRCMLAWGRGARDTDAMLLSAAYADRTDMCHLAISLGAHVTTMHMAAAAAEDFSAEVLKCLTSMRVREAPRRCSVNMTHTVLIGSRYNSLRGLLPDGRVSNDLTLYSASHLDKCPGPSSERSDPDNMFTWGCLCGNYSFCKYALHLGLKDPPSAMIAALNSYNLSVIKLLFNTFGDSIIQDRTFSPHDRLFASENYDFQKKLTEFLEAHGFKQQ